MKYQNSPNTDMNQSLRRIGNALVGSIAVLTIILVSIAAVRLDSVNGDKGRGAPDQLIKATQTQATAIPMRQVVSGDDAQVALAATRVNYSAPQYYQEEEEDPIPDGITTTRSGVIVTDFDEGVDYSGLMHQCLDQALESENPEPLLAMAEIYETKRNLKIESMGEDCSFEQTDIFKEDNDLKEIRHSIYGPYMEYTDYDLMRLACIIQAEGGSDYITDEHQRDIASVVINRLGRPGFANNHSIGSLIDSDGQYPATHNNRYYTERAMENARYVLEYGPTTTGVYQANFEQGVETLAIYEYPYCDPTYICQ